MATYLLLRFSFTTTKSLSLLTHGSSVTSAASHRGLKNSVSSQLSGRVRFNFQDDFCTGRDEDFDDFGFPGSAKHRTWWSNDEDDHWIDDDEEDDIMFWIFKVLRAFGWIFPAVGISLLLGTGPNAFIMALAVPLGQTALSLVFDKVSGSTSSRSKPRPRTRTKTRKTPFVRPTVKTSPRTEENKSYEEKEIYQSWMAADDGSSKKSNKRIHKFGGWDELDDAKNPSKGMPTQKVDDDQPKQRNRGKLSRTRRVRDTPLLFRLLFAVFPFLGSWTRFLF